MAKETGSGRVTRSSAETLYKKVVLSPSGARMGTPPAVAVRTKPPTTTATAMAKTPSPLRRSERTTRNPSPSSSSGPSPPSRKTVDAEGSAKPKKKMDARAYRNVFTFKDSKKNDCHVESNRKGNLTKEGGDRGRARGDKKGNSLSSKAVSKDGILPPEDSNAKDQSPKSSSSRTVKEHLENNVAQGLSVPSDARTHDSSGASERVQSDCHRDGASQTLAPRSSMLNKNLIRKCAGHDNVETVVPSKRKRTMGDKIDECFKGNSLDSKAVSKDGILPPKDSNAKDQSPKSSSSGPVKEILESNVTQGSPLPSGATTHETSGASERVQSDCHRDEASQPLASKSSMLNENSIQKCAGHDNGENVVPSKGKRTMGDKIDACFKGNSLDSKAVSEDGILPPEDSNAKDQSPKSSSSRHVKEILENNVTQGSPVPSGATTHETSGASERVQSDCHSDEASQMLASRSSMLNENFIRKCAGHDNGENVVPSKRKRTMGDKIDECFKGNSLDSKAVSKDGILPPEDSNAKDQSPKSSSCGPVKELLENNVAQVSSVPSDATTHETSGASERVQVHCHRDEASKTLASRSSMLNETLIRKRAGHDNGENLIPCKRQRTMGDKDSDISATLVDDENCNLTVDANPSSLCSNIVGTSEPCSKRIRRISLSDVQRDQKKSINNVDLPHSKSNGERLSTRNQEGNSGDSRERPLVNGVETDKIRKEQKRLHLMLKPRIARLCEILLLPDNVKNMVEKFLEYTMNNHQIRTQSVSILQAFQLSLCWTASSLLNHKLDFETSLMLAKKHLHFDCEKDVVIKVNSVVWDLKKNFLSLTESSKVTGSPQASESPSRNYSNTKVTVVEFAKRDISKNIKETQKHKNQWEKLLSMQLEEKQKLKIDIQKEEAEFQKRCDIELTALRSCSPNDVMKKERLMVYRSNRDKRFGELKMQNETRLKDLEAKQLEARRKFQESCSPDESFNLVASIELGAPRNAPKAAPKALVSDHVAEEKSSEKIGETMSMIGNGVGLSESLETNPSVVVLCSSPVELQTPIVTHAGVNEIDSMASKDELVFGNKSHNIAENKYEGQGNIFSKHSNSRERSSDGTTSREVDEGCEISNCESHNGCRQDSATLVQLSSDGEICDVETSDVPGREVALVVHQTGSSNDEEVDISSSKQGKPDGTILSKSVCSLSVKSNGFSDAVMNMASLNSQSPEKHIPGVNTMCMPNCKNTAQIHEPDDGHGSNNADTLNSLLSDERISSWNSKSPQQHVDSVNVMCGQNFENSALVHKAGDNNGSDNVITLSSLLIDERSAHDVLDKEVRVGIPGTVDFTPTSVEQIPVGSVNDSVLDRVLPTPCGTAGPSNSPDANAIILSNQRFQEKQNPDGISSDIPTGQTPVEVSETSHDMATLSELDKEAAVGMLGTVSCADCPNNATPLNSSSTDQVYYQGAVLTENSTLNSSSRPCTSSPSNDHPAAISLSNPPSQQQVPGTVLSTIPDGQIPVIMSESGHEEAECQLTGSAVVDKSTASEQQEGVHRTMIENTLSQVTTVSRSVDLIEPREERRSLSSLESPYNQLTAKEIQNSGVSNAVDILTVNQSNQTSLVMEPPEQVQQLPSAAFLSSNQDLSNLPLVTVNGDQTTNEDALSSHIPEASVEVQNQAVEQPASNLEVDPHLRQVVHPASNLDADSLMPGGVTRHSSDPRNLSTQGDVHTHPIPTATQSASRVVQPLCHDPLYNELGRIHKLAEQQMKNHEDMKLQCKSDYEKELVELHRKYEIKLKEIEDEFQRTKKELDTQRSTVNAHRILAKTFKATSLDLKVYGASGTLQDAGLGQQFSQLSRQQHASRPYMVSPPSSCVPSAASLPSSHASPGSQTMLPPTPATYNTTGVFSGVSARPPHINTISSPSGSIQAGGEIRAPAPHIQPFIPSTPVPPPSPPHVQPFRPSTSVLSPAPPHAQPFRPSSSVPAPAPPHPYPFRPSTLVAAASSLFTGQHMVPIYPAPGNIPLPSPSFSHLRPRPSTIVEPGHHRGHWPESTGGLPARNLPAMDLRPDSNSLSGNNLPNVLPRLSDLASLDLSKFVTNSSMRASSPHQAASPDVVCLSDDD